MVRTASSSEFLLVHLQIRAGGLGSRDYRFPPLLLSSGFPLRCMCADTNPTGKYVCILARTCYDACSTGCCPGSVAVSAGGAPQREIRHYGTHLVGAMPVIVLLACGSSCLKSGPKARPGSRRRPQIGPNPVGSCPKAEISWRCWGGGEIFCLMTNGEPGHRRDVEGPLI